MYPGIRKTELNSRVISFLIIVVFLIPTGCFDDDPRSRKQHSILSHYEMKEHVIEYFQSGGNISNISALTTEGWTISIEEEYPNQTYIYNNSQIWIERSFLRFAGIEFRCPSVKDIPEEAENYSEMAKEMEEQTLFFYVNVHPIFSEEDHIFIQEYLAYQKSSPQGYNCEILCETGSFTIVYHSPFIGNELDPKLGPLRKWG